MLDRTRARMMARLTLVDDFNARSAASDAGRASPSHASAPRCRHKRPSSADGRFARAADARSTICFECGCARIARIQKPTDALVRPSFAQASAASTSAVPIASSSFASAIRFVASFNAAAEARPCELTAFLILKMRNARNAIAETRRGICPEGSPRFVYCIVHIVVFVGARMGIDVRHEPAVDHLVASSPSST